jgi:hypothetical protein
VADYLLGRRFEFADQSAPDITITGFDPQQQRVRVHALDGGKQWVAFKLLYAAIFNGVVVESDKVGFVWPR